MKNVLYNTCYGDPWFKVAEILHNQHGLKPVYWNGYNNFCEDDSETIIPKMFPGIIYHNYWDAWKGIFPKEIEESYKETYIDVDFVRDLSSCELQAIKMMDRMDMDRHSFSYMERERHYLNYVKYWSACIKYCKIELVISAVVPHRVYDYILYLLCKRNNIPYLFFDYSSFAGRVYFPDDIQSMGDQIFSLYNRLINVENDKDSLPKEILDSWTRINKTYDDAIPYYMKQQKNLDKKERSIIQMSKSFIQDSKSTKQPIFGKNGVLRNGVKYYYKNRTQSIEESRFSLLKYVLMKIQNNKYKQNLKKCYQKQTSEPDYTKKYIVFFLHYQPEATTSPKGDIFVNQRLCIETLLRNTPSDYYIYVKEHSTQFIYQGNSSRIKEFYQDLLLSSRVKLMPLESDPFRLIDNSIAVSTVTGTVGWEAIVRHKPVICFGLIWYENYSGALKIRNSKDASEIMNFIENYSYSENNLVAYLKAFESVSFPAYIYKGYKEYSGLSIDDCANNLVSEIVNRLKLNE